MVGFFKPAPAAVYSTGESPFFVTEQFAVDRPRRDGAAVNRQECSAFTIAEIVNHTGKNLLSYPAFTDDQHRQVGFGHIQSRLNRQIQLWGVTYDAVAVLYTFNIYVAGHFADFS